MKLLARPPQLALHAETAADLMLGNPMSIREDASVQEAMVLFTTKGFSAAPVIDAAGRPVGVLSRSDIIIHERTNLEWGAQAVKPPIPETLTAKPAAKTRIRDLMTPAVFSVSPDTSAAKVVQEMLALGVHRLFVVEKDGVLVGVISALDVLRHLHSGAAAESLRI